MAKKSDPRKSFTDPLSMDVTNDLKRVDEVLTHLLKDPALWKEFIRDPNGVLIRLGLHPSTSPEIKERANRVFYATLANKRLVRLVLKHYEQFRPSKERMKKQRGQYEAGLKRGEIRHNIEFDLEAFHHILDHPNVLRNALRLSLHDLNEKGILQRAYKRGEIDSWINKTVEAMRQRLPISDFPKLEVWDKNYGVGQRYGMLSLEEALGVTTSIAVEGVVVVTAAVVAVVDVEVEVNGPIVTARLAAAQGNEESVRAYAILGRLLDFSAELLLHIQNFERRV